MSSRLNFSEHAALKIEPQAKYVILYGHLLTLLILFGPTWTLKAGKFGISHYSLYTQLWLLN